MKALDERPVCEQTLTDGRPCPAHTTRRCGTCNRLACSAHSRAPHGGPWFCFACEAKLGVPSRPVTLPDRQFRARGDVKVEVFVRGLKRPPKEA